MFGLFGNKYVKKLKETMLTFHNIKKWYFLVERENLAVILDRPLLI